MSIQQSPAQAQALHIIDYHNHRLSWAEYPASSLLTDDHTFVFFSGWSGVRAIWHPTIELLRPYGHCVTIDLPGHYPAHSPSDYQQLEPEQLFEMEAYAVQQICGNRPLTLIGHSTGGLVSLALATMLPQQVRRVVSICGVVWGPLGGILRLGQWLLRNRLDAAFRALWSLTRPSPHLTMLGLMFYTRKPLQHWMNPAAWQVAVTIHPTYRHHNLYDLAVALRMLERCDIRGMVQTVNVPVLVVGGSHDLIVDPTQAHWLADRLPQANLAILDSGHMPTIEQSDTFHITLTNWLKTHPL